MKCYRFGRGIVYVICAMLTIAAFFAGDFVLYQFHMMPSDYSFARETGHPPVNADSAVWFTYGSGKDLTFWTDADSLNREASNTNRISMYAKTADGIALADMENDNPIREDFTGYLIAVMEERQADIDGDGTPETVIDAARADFGPHAYAAVPRRFNSSAIPFEACFEERNKIQIFFQERAVADSRVLVTTNDFWNRVYETDASGYIKGLPVKYIRSGLTISYELEEGTVYRMHYALEDYDYFSPHFWKAQIPLLLICVLTAAGAYPVRLCSGSFMAYSISDGLAARDSCPLVKAVAGFACSGTMPLYDDCALMVIPVTCDCKKKIAGLLGQRIKTAVMQLPQGKHADGDREMFRKELYRIIPLIEEAAGRQITTRTLAEAVNHVGYAQYEMARFSIFRRNVPPLISGAQVMAVMNAYAYMPVEKWADAMHHLNGELERRLQNQEFAAKHNRPRILLTGSPVTFPNMKIPLLIEEMGGSLVADETCLGERAMYDPVSVVDAGFDGMIRAIADRYVKPCTCPVFADNTQRIFRIRQMVREYQVQGVVYHVLRGCLVYDYEYPVLEEELDKLGIPVIRMESDYNEEDVEQLRIRMEAFIEMIRLNKFSEEQFIQPGVCVEASQTPESQSRI